jgi:hypothetical protein
MPPAGELNPDIKIIYHKGHQEGTKSTKIYSSNLCVLSELFVNLVVNLLGLQ